MIHALEMKNMEHMTHVFAVKCGLIFSPALHSEYLCVKTCGSMGGNMWAEVIEPSLIFIYKSVFVLMLCLVCSILVFGFGALIVQNINKLCIIKHLIFIILMKL